MKHKRKVALARACAVAVFTVPVAVVASAGTAGAQDEPPIDFQLPFPCGDEWRLDTWGHAPALDMVKEPDQTGTEGAQLVAAADGVVVQSYRHDNAGNMVQIDHGDGYFTTHIHMQDRSVSVGDEVAQGDEIGHVGRDGPTANDHPHLHFELAISSGDTATWGYEGSDRVRPWFDGVEYGQSNGETWRDVESANCGTAGGDVGADEGEDEPEEPAQPEEEESDEESDDEPEEAQPAPPIPGDTDHITG